MSADGNEIERREEGKGVVLVAPSIERSPCKVVKRYARVYKVSSRTIENWEEELEERKGNGGNKWRMDTGRASHAVLAIDPVSNQRFSIQISVGGTPI